MRNSPIRLLSAAALAALTALALAAAPPAMAQKKPEPRWAKASFNKYIDTVRYVSILKYAVEVADKRNRPHCYGRSIVRPYHFRIEYVNFSPKTRKPVRGYWREILVVKGCDAPLAYPIWMFMTGPGKVFAFAVVPGKTRSDAYQMRSAMHQILKISAKTVLSCTRVRFLGSKPTSGTVKSKSWTEEWRTNVCGRMLTYELRFSPSAEARKPKVSVRLLPEAEGEDDGADGENGKSAKTPAKKKDGPAKAPPKKK